MTFEEAWALLEQVAAVGDHVEKHEVITGLETGKFVLFTRAQSAALAAHCHGFLRVGMAGGEMSEMLDIEDEITRYARAKGYPFVEIVGRPGWEKALPGYTRVAVVLRKEL